MMLPTATRSSQRPNYVGHYLRRLLKPKQMDFEYTFWTMLQLVVSPRTAYRHTAYHKQTKNHWARDDPAFLLVMCTLVMLTACAYCLAFSDSLGHAVMTVMSAVMFDFLLLGCAIATAGWLLSNNFLRKRTLPSHQVEQHVEWLYAFDVHCNSYFPLFLLLYVLQLLLSPILLWRSFLSTALSTALYAGSLGYYHYMTFLGYSSLPFLEHTEAFLWPIGLIFLSIPFDEVGDIDQLVEEAVHSGCLDLSSLSLTSVPPHTFSCVGLAHLNLSCNSLCSLSSEIGVLLSLTELDVNYNKLEKLPASLCKLTRLNTLKASYNQISELGPELSGLTSLVSLHLHDNHLMHLPPSFTTLMQLEELQLQYNQLLQVPLQLRHLTALKSVDLQGNPMQSSSKALLQLARSRVLEDQDMLKFRKALAVEAGGELDGNQLALNHAAASSNPAAVPTSTIGPHTQVMVLNSEGDVAEEMANDVHMWEQPLDPTLYEVAGASTWNQLHKPCHLSDSAPSSALRTSEGKVGEEVGDSSEIPDMEASVMREVMDLPPAAAAAMYRAWDTVRTGVHEVQEGRPLTRGGTADPHSSTGLSRLLASSSIRFGPGTAQGLRPGSVAPGHLRAGLTFSSSHRRPPTAGGARPGTAAGGSSSRLPLTEQSVTSLLEGTSRASQASESETRSARALSTDINLQGAVRGTGGGGFEGLPPITFPLTSGVRSMLRQISAGKSRAAAPAQLSAHAVELESDAQAGRAHLHGFQGAYGETQTGSTEEATGTGVEPHPHLHHVEATAVSACSTSSAHSAGIRSSFSFGKPEGLKQGATPQDANVDEALDLVRSMLGSRNPGLLATLDTALFDNEPFES
ncbi:hypothetical protein CEUSTIGMA_g1027.t1 [Chlamydomonas eustigma]|uniref:Uncharacterized protein n=1 Tax=Chlamydomonas eustigma TaxID=1157962 RepID=A0A250WS82_9CHLO|nr:hypothetical protein CEUSTIGMA_g1027.t1 [Chlamydomonas eustigma]|eukprot:GAX73576.1 hypothetical protein CEUSTIGMA_g1027.t1 [Chlamydomonas eustigma]